MAASPVSCNPTVAKHDSSGGGPEQTSDHGQTDRPRIRGSHRHAHPGAARGGAGRDAADLQRSSDVRTARATIGVAQPDAARAADRARPPAVAAGMAAIGSPTRRPLIQRVTSTSQRPRVAVTSGRVQYGRGIAGTRIARRRRSGTDLRQVGKQRLILIVDDDADLRRVWKLTLNLEAFDVEEAGDGLEALRRIEERLPDLVVLDLGLPTLGGLSVQQEIAARAVTRNIPVVIVTGSTQDLSSVDVPCVLRKPVSPEELVRAVRTCLLSSASLGS